MVTMSKSRIDRRENIHVDPVTRGSGGEACGGRSGMGCAFGMPQMNHVGDAKWLDPAALDDSPNDNPDYCPT